MISPMEIDLMTKFNRGLVLALLDNSVYEAIQTYRQYISYLNSNNFEDELIKTRAAFLNKLVKYTENNENQNNLSELISAYQELIVNFPNESKFYLKCALCFLKLEQNDIALELLYKAEKTGDDIEIKRLIYETLNKAKDYINAKKYAEIIVKLNPLDPDNYYNLSTTFNMIHTETGNEECLKSAILNMEIARKMEPQRKLFTKGLLVLYLKTKDETKKDELWSELFKFKDVNSRDLMDYAAHLIRKGDFKTGFEFYENRFNLDKDFVDYPKFNKPKYDGKKDISDKTLLVQYEQGYGDVFLFSRYIKELGTKKTILRVPNPLFSLIKRSFPNFEIVLDNANFSELKFDYHTPLMSIPRLIKLSPDNLLREEKYIFADEKKVKEFREKYFNNNNFKIGIAYKGKQGGMAIRNIDVEKLFPISEIKGTSVYSLQFGENDMQFKNSKIINLSDKIKDFDDTAAMIENLDLVVTIDNSIMNLSGAMGKKTFCLFGFLPEFRWFDLSGEDVKWYKTVKPYQCEHWGAWEPVIEKVVKDIKGLMA